MENNPLSDKPIDENIKSPFIGFIKSLIVLSSTPQKQIEIMGDCVITDELALDFDAFYLREIYLENKLLNEFIVPKLDQIETCFTKHSDNKSSAFWNVKTFANNEDWKSIRSKANEILAFLEMDNLEIQIDSQTLEKKLIKKNAL